MFLRDATLLFFIIAARYFAVAGAFYFVVWVWGGERFASRKLQSATPSREVRLAEIKWSILSSAIFAVVGAAMFRAWEGGYTRLELAPAAHGWLWTVACIPLLMFLHDTYFYFTHRLMHHKRFFARVHRAHHDSRTPSPWAAFSFHPWEAFVEAGAFPLFAFTMPVPLVSFFTFLSIMTLLSVVNHLGYEFGRWTPSWLIGATHHDLHHRVMRHHYGLYFTFWDRLLGTEKRHVVGAPTSLEDRRSANAA